MIVPLLIASWVIIIYEEWGHWLLIHCQLALYELVHQIHALVPFENGSLHFAKIIYLFLVASLPMWISELSALRKAESETQTPRYWIGLVLWVFAAVLLTLSSFSYS